MNRLTFEWDEAKAQANLAKHGVDFAEARTVFNDPLAMTIPDPDHSATEDRWLDIGMSARGRLLVVYYTERRLNLRIIGCRQATRTERTRYEEERKD